MALISSLIALEATLPWLARAVVAWAKAAVLNWQLVNRDCGQVSLQPPAAIEPLAVCCLVVGALALGSNALCNKHLLGQGRIFWAWALCLCIWCGLGSWRRCVCSRVCACRGPATLLRACRGPATLLSACRGHATWQRHCHNRDPAGTCAVDLHTDSNKWGWCMWHGAGCWEGGAGGAGGHESLSHKVQQRFGRCVVRGLMQNVCARVNMNVTADAANNKQKPPCQNKPSHFLQALQRSRDLVCARLVPGCSWIAGRSSCMGASALCRMHLARYFQHSVGELFPGSAAAVAATDEA